LQIKALDAIDRNTQAQVQLVDDLLDSQRILCGKLELVPARVPLQTIVDEAMDSVLPAAQNKRIRLENAGEVSAVVRVDPDRLRQALVKLLSNAVKFTPEGGRVVIRSRLVNDKVMLFIADTGIGIPQQSLTRLGRPFEQVESQLTKTYHGSGLGLAIARSLANLHGGTMRLRSRIGKGTVVCISLPRQPQAGAKAAA
jgi:two-component system, cell cycle sensor histidine kinase PleC